MGTFFGSFFTLAVYRIPLGKDITHERSFCPTCNHKLGAWDLIPVWSYLFLKGKCRYCGEKVRIRYFILEILSGIVFVIAYVSYNIQNVLLEPNKLAIFIAFVMMYVTLILVAGIDKEYRKINASVLGFGVICQSIYMLYLCMIEKENDSIYRYTMYFASFILVFIVFKVRQKNKSNYPLQVGLLFTYILCVIDWKASLMIVLFSFLDLIIWKCVSKKQKLPWGFVMSLCTIVYVIVENGIKFWMI